jgi:hypothetical protein
VGIRKAGNLSWAPGQKPSAVAPSSEEDERRKIAVGLVDGALRRQRFFGLPISQLSEVEDLKEIRQA